MTVADMVSIVKSRTHQVDDTKVINELKAAYSWVCGRVFNSENGPDLLVTLGEEISIASRTRDYDLGGNLANTLLGIKQLWLKLTSDTLFTPMNSADTNREEFIRNDNETASDTTVVATGHPVYYDVRNFSQVRFAPALPADCTIRVDYYRLAPDIDPTTNNTLSDGADMPAIFDWPIINEATALCFVGLDDDRVAFWERKAEQALIDALHVANRRVQGPKATTPYRARRRRFI